jgi:uncharacterized membrane protein
MKSKSLILFCFFSFALSIARICMSYNLNFVYLNWNLFLAILPLIFASVLQSKQYQGLKFWFLISSWFLFFPNAPYLVTDLMYLSKIKTHIIIPFWFDVVMLSSFAINGLLLGYASSRIIFTEIENKFSKNRAHIFTIFSLMISGYGIYIGRFWRYNSWDIFTHPNDLFFDIAQTILHPLHHKNVIGLSILFGILLCLVFYSLLETSNNKTKI